MRLLALWLAGFAAVLAWRAQAIMSQSRLPELSGNSVLPAYQVLSAFVWCLIFAIFSVLIATRRVRMPRVTILAMVLYHAQTWLDAALLFRAESAQATLGFRALLSFVALAITLLLAWRAGRETAPAGRNRILKS